MVPWYLQNFLKLLITLMKCQVCKRESKYRKYCYNYTSESCRNKSALIKITKGVYCQRNSEAIFKNIAEALQKNTGVKIFWLPLKMFVNFETNL